MFYIVFSKGPFTALSYLRTHIHISPSPLHAHKFLAIYLDILLGPAPLLFNTLYPFFPLQVVSGVRVCGTVKRGGASGVRRSFNENICISCLPLSLCFPPPYSRMLSFWLLELGRSGYMIFLSISPFLLSCRLHFLARYYGLEQHGPPSPFVFDFTYLQTRSLPYCYRQHVSRVQHPSSRRGFLFIVLFIQLLPVYFNITRYILDIILSLPSLYRTYWFTGLLL